MNGDTVFVLSMLVLFLFTLLFSYGYLFMKRVMNTYSYVKCFIGGFIIAILLSEVLPDFYGAHGNSLCSITSMGISFFVLFAISKIYIERVNSSEQDAIPKGASQAEAVVFILALSLHSFMEGLGVSSKFGHRLTRYLISIAVHKWLEALVLGASVLSSGFSEVACFFMLVTYSALTSIGALLGRAMANSSFQGLNNATMILDGVAGGSFLYIGFVEMVGNEFEGNNSTKSRLVAVKKTCAMIAGYLFTTIMINISHLQE